MKRFPASGALSLPGSVSVEALERGVGIFDDGVPGSRLDVSVVEGLDVFKPMMRCVSEYLGTAARPVRAIAFDKRDGVNWALGWHQDRTIEVSERRDVDGFGPWTLTQGRIHVAPPFSILERMLTARLHFDAVDAENAPLLVAVGSHLRGLISEEQIGDVVLKCDSMMCLAEAGDIWLYATPILHASARAAAPRRRRVLQVDFSSDVLPGGLAWVPANSERTSA